MRNPDRAQLEHAKDFKQEISVKKKSYQHLLESIRSYQKQEREVDHEIQSLAHERDTLIADLKQKHIDLEKKRDQSLSLRQQYDFKIKEYNKIEEQLQHELQEIQEREAQKRKYIHNRQIELAARHCKPATKVVRHERPTASSERPQQIQPLRHRIINKSTKNLRSNGFDFERQPVHPSKTSPDSSIGLWTDTEWW